MYSIDRPYAARTRSESLQSSAFFAWSDRNAVEDRAVADVAPVDQLRDAGPRRVARHQVDLREDGTAVGFRELEALQGREDVLVGHRGVREPRAAIADVTPVVDLVVAVERRPLRPLPVVRRHVIDGPPPGPLERPAECEAVGLDELVVAPLAVDPETRLHGGVRQPAGAAERRRGEEGAPGGEAGGLQSPRPLVESSIDPWREGGALDRALSVALDEREDDVLAVQAGQQLAARGVAEAVVPDLGGEDLVVLEARLHRTYLVDRQAGGARGGDGRAGDELRTERPTEHPDDAERRDGLERPAPVAGRDPGQAKHRQGREDEEGDARAPPRRRRPGSRRSHRSSRAASRCRSRCSSSRRRGRTAGRRSRRTRCRGSSRSPADREPVRRSRPGGVERWRAGRGPAAMRTRPSSGTLTNALGRETTRLVGSDEGGPHEQNGEDREHRGDTVLASASAPGVRPRRVGRARRCSSVRVPAAPQPPDVAAERLGKQGKRDDEGGLGQSQRQDVCSRDRQNDPLGHSNDLAPVARRQRLTQPRQRTTRLRGTRSVPRRSRAPTRRPSGRHTR